MRYFTFIILFFISTLALGQERNIIGTYRSKLPIATITFNQDSTFQYTTKQQHPVFYRWEDFCEKGRWALSGDTIILNPDLSKKVFVESDFVEGENYKDTSLLLTFNHIKRYFDIHDNIIKEDTLQMEMLDYSFNELKKRRVTRVARHRAPRCTFAGYIPKEIITSNRTISIRKPAVNIKSIFIGCSELQGTKEFIIKNPNSNQLILNVYSNYYQEGQIRQMKLLIKNEKVLYTRQKENGEFEKDNIWSQTYAKLERQ